MSQTRAPLVPRLKAAGHLTTGRPVVGCHTAGCADDCKSLAFARLRWLSSAKLSDTVLTARLFTRIDRKWDHLRAEADWAALAAARFLIRP